jgi:L-alanine-DL-glutamate epimerase-like enolase superfamily enzyme
VQITHVEVIPVEFELRLPYRVAQSSYVERVAAVFIRIETRQGDVAWGCAALDPAVTSDSLDEVIRVCQACADRAPDLNPPLHRLLGGYRHRIETSVTIGIVPMEETVELARERCQQGFRILKMKGGLDPHEDVRRVQAVHSALPNLTLRLDADQGYTVEQALDVARALASQLEMLEQPTPADDLEALKAVTQHSPVPILADESVTEPPSALKIASSRAAHGMSVKLTTCGGLHCARQVDTIARSAHMETMVGCVHEPALLIAAGLSLALSSPNVRYGDLDGHFDLIDDPTCPGFLFEDGWLVATDVPGLGCTVDL